MSKELLFSFASPSRDTLEVHGFRFGQGKGSKTVIVSGLNGEEIGGVFASSQLVAYLYEKLEANRDFVKSEILIVPSVNHFALNMGNRFWPFDNTDINVMFPGYDKGETTQRIAHKLFAHIGDATYGILLEDRKDKATCMPYMKLIEPADVEGAKRFGLPFVHIKKFVPTDSGSLLYNWSVWGTKAYSIVMGDQQSISQSDTDSVVEGMLRFLASVGAIESLPFGGYKSEVILQEKIEVIKSQHAGILKQSVAAGAKVKKGQLLGTVFDALDGSIKEYILAPNDGVITCLYNYPLIYQYSIAYRIAMF